MLIGCTSRASACLRWLGRLSSFVSPSLAAELERLRKTTNAFEQVIRLSPPNGPHQAFADWSCGCLCRRRWDCV